MDARDHVASMNFNDACNLWIERLGPFDWKQCCVQHDFDYGHQVLKTIADVKLEQCVNAVLPGMGLIMWIGVTIFGGLWYVMAKRKRA